MEKISKELQVELNESTPVEFTNLMGWNIGFPGVHAYPDGCVVTAYQEKRLPLKEIVEQVNNANSAFVGIDGKGAHAAFIIEDEKVRNLVFKTDVEPIQLTQARIEKMLKATTKEAFRKLMEELIVTYGEAREMLYRMDNLGLKNLQGWKEAELTDYCKRKIASRINSSNTTTVAEKPHYR